MHITRDIYTMIIISADILLSVTVIKYAKYQYHKQSKWK